MIWRLGPSEYQKMSPESKTDQENEGQQSPRKALSERMPSVIAVREPVDPVAALTPSRHISAERAAKARDRIAARRQKGITMNTPLITLRMI